MTSKRWMLVVTELGSSTPLRNALVEAGNWMAAIKEGRRALGEVAAVPAGSSCQVAPDGKVTVHAPMERQTYLLYPEGSPAAATLGPLPDPVHSVVPSAPQGAGAAPPAPPRRERPKTMAYVPEQPIVPPDPATQPARRPRPKTMAYIPPAELPKPPAQGSREIAVGEPPRPSGPVVPAAARASSPAAAAPAMPAQARAAAPAVPAAAREPQSAQIKRQPPYELVASRDEAPTDESPLHYRERAFAAAPGTTQAEAESIARAGLRALQNELSGAPKGQLLHVAVFDHKWSGQPIRPAIVALEWKDWRDELSVQYPLAEFASRMSAPAMTATASHHLDLRHRLAVAAEGFEDMAFLDTPEDAMVFATRLLEELVDAPIIAGSLYDMATDALHICAERGTAGRLGAGLPRGRGLLGAAAEDLDAPLSVVDPRTDPRFEATIDGAPGIEPSALMWVPLGHRGDLVGMLQLASSTPGASFGADDATVALTIAQRVATFIHQLHVHGRARG